jgi:Domain of unknown function (DUF397)
MERFPLLSIKDLRSGGPVAMVDWTRATWRKSTRSADGPSCLEIALVDHVVGVRHSRDPDGPVLVFDAEQWRRFVAALKRGDFDPL